MEVQYGPFQTMLVLLRAFRLVGRLKYVQVEGMWKSYLWNWDSEWHKLILDIQTIHDKVGSQDENSREH